MASVDAATAACDDSARERYSMTGMFEQFHQCKIHSRSQSGLRLPWLVCAVTSPIVHRALWGGLSSSSRKRKTPKTTARVAACCTHIPSCSTHAMAETVRATIMLAVHARQQWPYKYLALLASQLRGHHLRPASRRHARFSMPIASRSINSKKRCVHRDLLTTPDGAIMRSPATPGSTRHSTFVVDA